MEQDTERAALAPVATEQSGNDAENERNLVGVFAILHAVERRLQKQGLINPPTI